MALKCCNLKSDCIKLNKFQSILHKSPSIINKKLKTATQRSQ